MIKPLVFIRCLSVTAATIGLLVACKPPKVFTDSPNVLEKANQIEDPQARQAVLNNYIPCEIPSLETTPLSSDTLAIDIYVDGSDSMQGYVRPSSSEYQQTLQSLASIFSNKNPNYYRVGTQKNNSEYSDGLSNTLTRQEFRKAQTMDFYGLNPQQFPRVTSSLHKAIRPLNGQDKLSIIITDLEQDGRDIDNITKLITAEYLSSQSENYAIGILGIKSQFSGQVTPVNKQYYPYQYNGKRPFYIILIAPYNELLSYYDLIAKDNSDLIAKNNFSLFYAQGIVKRPAHFDGKTQLPDDFYRPQSLNDGKIAVEVAVPPYDLIEIPNRLNQETYKISYVFPLNWLDFSPKPDSSSIQLRHRVRIYDPLQQRFVEQNDDTLENAIIFDQLNFTEEQLKFDSIITPKNFSANSNIYLLTIDLIFDDIQDEIWWKDWDWVSKEHSKDGSKTDGIFNFMRNLKRETINFMVNNQEGNIIGRFCYGIQKN